MKLSDLKAALARAGVASEWEGPGALLAARGRVRVRLAGGARAGGALPGAICMSPSTVAVHFCLATSRTVPLTAAAHGCKGICSWM